MWGPGICYKGFKGKSKEQTHVWEARNADINFPNKSKTGQHQQRNNQPYLQGNFHFCDQDSVFDNLQKSLKTMKGPEGPENHRLTWCLVFF